MKPNPQMETINGWERAVEVKGLPERNTKYHRQLLEVSYGHFELNPFNTTEAREFYWEWADSGSDEILPGSNRREKAARLSVGTSLPLCYYNRGYLERREITGDGRRACEYRFIPERVEPFI